ncbi:NADPH-dependent assimilatory sulfite reductase hemoprotein subunit [Myroides odoratimimus]|uniref:NADPH-dependent assimilatory sulfite reductase hemoprotein subunit n=1 Tax=Myroides odoratimimus TaxID=76832 RepID=UPI002577198D|nr:NADPH-dependent assimilatory sulfite reductase hemoprotein subunit [Myroides odoratimimus]MDM1397979.1 NADPH-dependent assimilatory sulfite reductase hemoprotein subunit [Myroides odoratimimus]
MNQDKLSPIEGIKEKSDGLRGTLAQSLKDNYTGNVRPDDEALIKFHGMYVQDDRDRRQERAEKKLDKLYSFMIRLRIPGGVISAKQWQAIHEISELYGTGVLKITTRQTIQLHGLLKHQLSDTIQGFLLAKLDAIAACGDVNRNVICSSHPQVSPVFEQIHNYADKISKMLLPKTQSYYELWIDNEKIYDRSIEADPLYQDKYLPRKFKIAIAIPPTNDVDVFANDIGLIAIVEDDKLIGFNIAIGGGLSTTHGNEQTYSRLATVIGFSDNEEDTMKLIYEVLTIQRDYGNRSDRKLARLKYTLDRLGVENFVKELEHRAGVKLQPARAYEFTERNDRYGWQQAHEGKWYYTLFVENGVVQTYQKEFLYNLSKLTVSDFKFTCNQNLILGEIEEEDKWLVEKLLVEHAIELRNSKLRESSISCVALPTCPLALAEAQRYLPELISKVEPLLAKHNLGEEEISIRMTGCPNGCGRSYLAEIGFVGTGPQEYNLMLGGDRYGTRLNQLYKKKIKEEEILSHLDNLFGQYKEEALAKETFGDFTYRKFFA